MDARAQYRASFSGMSCRLFPVGRLSRLTSTGEWNTSPGRTSIGGWRITVITQGLNGGSAPSASLYDSLDVIESPWVVLAPLRWPFPLTMEGRPGLAPSLRDDPCGKTEDSEGVRTGIWPFGLSIGVEEVEGAGLPEACTSDRF